MDVAQGVDIREKMDYYQNAYDSAQVNDIKEYTGQTLGNIIDQMSTDCYRRNRNCSHHCCIDHCIIPSDVIIKGYVSDCHHAKCGINF